MGDLNAPVSSRELQDFCTRLKLSAPTSDLATYPSWQPQRAIDHILVSASLDRCRASVVDVGYSDHCPVELKLELPSSICLRPAMRPVVSIEARALDNRT
jgi:endonuclease/exonuclease/phosphatase family metal-dependent hydrolase